MKTIKNPKTKYRKISISVVHNEISMQFILNLIYNFGFAEFLTDLLKNIVFILFLSVSKHVYFKFKQQF